MLTYLEAQLHPEKSSRSGDTAEASLPAAIVQSHQLRANVTSNHRIALAWIYSTENETYLHAGGSGGHSSYAFFHPQGDYAAVVLVNQHQGLASFADLL